MKFALFFGNRGFMPAELIAGARADMIRAVADAGHESLVMDADATRYGAVETREEGEEKKFTITCVRSAKVPEATI